MIEGLMSIAELDRRQVIEARVRPHGIVMTSPGSDENACFGAAAEPLEAQTFVAKPTVEAFIGSVLPGLSRIDERRTDLLVGKPLGDSLADELRAIVGANKCRCSSITDLACEDLDHVLRTDAAGDLDCQALAGELIDQRQAFELLSVGAGIEQKIDRPDRIRAAGRPWPRP